MRPWEGGDAARAAGLPAHSALMEGIDSAIGRTMREKQYHDPPATASGADAAAAIAATMKAVVLIQLLLHTNTLLFKCAR